MLVNSTPHSESLTLQSRMSDQAAKSTKPRTPSRLGKGPTSSSWKPGQSGNPKGRPRTGLALAERGRERLDPDRLLDLADRVLDDETLSPAARIAIVTPVYDRIYAKPATDQNLTLMHAGSSDDERLNALPLEKLRSMRAEYQAALESTAHQPADAVTQASDDTHDRSGDAAAGVTSAFEQPRENSTLPGTDGGS